MYKNITIIISGPLHKTGVENIRYYKSLGMEVVVSTYIPMNNDEKKILDNIKSLCYQKNIVISEYHIPSEYIDNIQNVFYHANAIKEGCKLVTTDFVIKIRSSIKFNNIIPLIDMLVKNPTKILTINAFWRPINRYPYHPSDFVFGMQIQEMMSVIDILIDSLKISNFYASEKKFCYAMLKNRGLIPNENDLYIVKKQLQNNWTVVDVNLLEPVLNYHTTESSSGKNVTYFHGTGVDISISDINNLII